MSKKDLVKKETYEVAEELPEWLRADDGDDFEMDADELLTPRLLVAQPTSEVVTGERTAEPGQWYNSLTREPYDEPLQIIPIFKSNYRVKWQDAGIGLDCLAPDGKVGSNYGECINCQYYFAKDDKGRAICNKGISLLVYIVNTKEVAVLPVHRTKLTPIKRMLTTLKLKRAKLYSYIWNLSSEKKKNDQGIFYIPKLIQAGFITKELAMEIEAIKRSFNIEEIHKSVEAEVKDSVEINDTAETPDF